MRDDEDDVDLDRPSRGLKTYRSTRIETKDNIVIVETEHTGVDVVEYVTLTIDSVSHKVSRLAVGALIEALREHV